MFEARAARPRPHLDDKVLTAWNGLMIAAFARAARVLRRPGLRRQRRRCAAALPRRAERAARFLRQHGCGREATSACCAGSATATAAIDAFSEDYAYLVWGLLELFQAVGGAEWLEWAIALQRRQDELFWDEADAGWFSTTGNDPSVLLRLKEDYDGAEPAASSVSVLNLLTLSHLVSGDEWPDRIERTLGTLRRARGDHARARARSCCRRSRRITRA